MPEPSRRLGLRANARGPFLFGVVAMTRVFDLDLGSAKWRTLNDTALLNAFGPKRDERDHNGKPLCRLVKDVLSVGTWHPRPGVAWAVDTATLDDIASNFSRMKSSGVEVNLCNTHGDPLTGIVHPRDLIEPIDDIQRVGDTLYATVYVDLATAESLRKRTAKVSPRCAEAWVDGAGNEYPGFSCLHVAVTDLPVQPKQQAFHDLANAPVVGGSAMDIAALVQLINRALPEGVALPEDTSEENILAYMQIVLDTLGINNGSAPAEPESPVEEATGEVAEAAVEVGDGSAGMDTPAVDMSQANAGLMRTIRDLSRKVDSLVSDRTRQAKEAYEGRLVELGRAGVAAPTIAHYRNLGAKYAYDLSLLAGVGGTIDMSRNGRSLATGAARSFSGEIVTDEDRAAALRERGVDPAKFLPGYRKGV